LRKSAFLQTPFASSLLPICASVNPSGNVSATVASSDEAVSEESVWEETAAEEEPDGSAESVSVWEPVLSAVETEEDFGAPEEETVPVPWEQAVVTIRRHERSRAAVFFMAISFPLFEYLHYILISDFLQASGFLKTFCFLEKAESFRRGMETKPSKRLAGCSGQPPVKTAQPAG
jgi:hypothetical protein